MSYDELYAKILEILPYATMGEDNEGQLIVYTNKMCVPDDSEYVEDMEC